MPSTGVVAGATFGAQSAVIAARRSIDMERVGSLLRSSSSRIRRRLALIVEIAAASLPSVGV
jgi:hypothetical protein